MNSLFVPNGLWPLLWCNFVGPQPDCLDSVSASSPSRDRAQGVCQTSSIIQLSLRTPSVPHVSLHHFACLHYCLSPPNVVHSLSRCRRLDFTFCHHFPVNPVCSPHPTSSMLLTLPSCVLLGSPS
ncbi:hypothetical protein DFH08DRAFT_833147 [Mycena albidolilacea]|uniref:Uncharacterized protein n=1 Tax=Mycena albidolilacea TaxID=1033008 RepID=A0AAD7AW44_9AGAR|nr:hypothetical protein DFH08DRAFT_833147 [Mycena albidolilacea]